MFFQKVRKSRGWCNMVVCELDCLVCLCLGLIGVGWGWSDWAFFNCVVGFVGGLDVF